MNRSQRLPQTVHLMAVRHRRWRLCGVETGGYIRLSERKFLRNFLRLGGGLCPKCARLAEVPREKRSELATR